MDARTRYFRQVRRLRRSARRWSVLAGTLGGASAILVPYHGLGAPDAIWAALTGGTAALTYWRWNDLRELDAQPPPGPGCPAPTAAVERALRLTPGESGLEQAHGELLGHFTAGVTAYEGLVGAAAGYVAVDGRATADTSSVSRLTEATDLLRGIADGLAEMTTGG